jgi:hypothetical protein
MIDRKYLKVKPSNLDGSGLFTTVKINARYPIIEVTGDIFDLSTVPDHPAVIQVTPKLFIGPSGGPDDYINHSCNPNCFISIIGNRAILYSLYVISPDTELTFDYSSGSSESLDSWKMNCSCGAVTCRKIISGFQYLTDEQKKVLLDLKAVPPFITDGIFR